MLIGQVPILTCSHSAGCPFDQVPQSCQHNLCNWQLRVTKCTNIVKIRNANKQICLQILYTLRSTILTDTTMSTCNYYKSRKHSQTFTRNLKFDSLLLLTKPVIPQPLQHLRHSSFAFLAAFVVINLVYIPRSGREFIPWDSPTLGRRKPTLKNTDESVIVFIT